MNTDITSAEYVIDHLKKLSNDAKTKLSITVEGAFSNKLDFIFEKSKLEKYDEIINSTLVDFNKLNNNVEEFIVKIVKSIDDTISIATKKRTELPQTDEVQVGEEGMKSRGEISGEITALVDIKIMAFDISSNLARKLAKSLNR